MTSMRLGRRLMAAATDAADDAMDALQRQIAGDDAFFCETMELIPAQYYFPTDEEDNWRKSAPKKYHRVCMQRETL